MKLLLDGRLAPITSEFGFLEVGCAEAAQAYANWQSACLTSRGTSMRLEEVSTTSLDDALRRLLPLTSVLPTRALFIPTTGSWTAFFENAVHGADAMAPMSYLAKALATRGMRVVAVPDTISTSGERGRYGATVLELYGPEDGEFLNYIRSVASVNDGGRWKFVEAGTPQPFEEPVRYKARAVRDRFTPEMLERKGQAADRRRLVRRTAEHRPSGPGHLVRGDVANARHRSAQHRRSRMTHPTTSTPSTH